AGSSRIRLYHSVDGALVAARGAVVRGADDAIALAADTSPLPAALAERFRFIGAGARLALPAAARARLPALLRGQLVLVREDASGSVLDATALQSPGALDALYPAAARITGFGATPAATATRFRVWAPGARAVSVCVYARGDAPADGLLPLRREDATGAWSVDAPADLRGRYYAYLVDVYARGTGVVRNRVTDPYSTSLTTDSARSYVADLDDPALAPAGWGATPAPASVHAAPDMAVYELHVRDFSASDASVPAAHRGKYLAFADAGSAGMRHLRALAAAGITDVHLLPVFDFASVPEAGCVTPSIPRAAADSERQQAAVVAVAGRDCFNWGYEPWHFGAPEGSYATDPADGAVRIREFRAMVQALHASGLRVGMDLVFNHTNASGQSPRSVLDRIVPGYYQRLDADGNVEHSTCCENTATEHAMMGKLMVDMAVRWAAQYHVDSFRFDLMGHQPRAAMETLQRAVDAATGRHVDLFGEGWNFGEIADGRRFVQASQLSLAGSGIGTFSDRARDAIRGGSPGDHGVALVARQGYINGLAYDPNDAAPPASRDALLRAADMVRVGLAGSLRDYVLHAADGRDTPLHAIDYNGQPAGYASQPSEVVNYVENHDNLTLFDLDALKLPRATSRADRVRVQMLGVALTAFSQGIAYFHGGMDGLRSKSLDGNSFDSGDWFNRVDWSDRVNGFGAGLPPREGNGADWPWMRPLLADPAIRPRPRDIAAARAMFRDLLRIRASTPLFRLRTAEEIRARLRFDNTGP
ncbi:MAG TPA: alpha-1,6-glucosidase domain-containing protein, partial [Xanthomonadaceae bacterium]|nr:alpha-1,6-glucosidase domain-containing protein [Xanthomonadaceae bacterium]